MIKILPTHFSDVFYHLCIESALSQMISSSFVWNKSKHDMCQVPKLIQQNKVGEIGRGQWNGHLAIPKYLIFSRKFLIFESISIFWTETIYSLITGNKTK